MTEKTIAESSRRGNEVREDEIDLLMLASHFLEHAKFIIVSLFIGAFLFGVVSMFLIHPKYESTAKLYIISASKGSIVDLTDLNVGTTLTADYEELIISEPVAEQVIKNLKLKETPEKLLKKISISNPQDTRVLYITATTESPSESMKLANEFMDVSLKYLPDTMSTNPPNVAQRAKMPDKKSGPSNSRNTLIGALLGFILACGILTVQYLKDDTIHSAEEFENYFGIMPIASIPEGSGDLFDKEEEGKKREKRKGRKHRSKKNGGAR